MASLDAEYFALLDELGRCHAVSGGETALIRIGQTRHLAESFLVAHATLGPDKRRNLHRAIRRLDNLRHKLARHG